MTMSAGEESSQTSSSTTIAEESRKSLLDVARDLGRYSIDAFEFLREGLDHTVQRKHGPDVEQVRHVLQWMEENDLDVVDLATLYEREKLPAPVQNWIEATGGLLNLSERLNLHISGQELCYGLRDLAIERWGLLAPVVLAAWGIRSTRDFGRMVFALVDNHLLQKQPDDCIEDFDDVYDFRAAFEGTYRIDLNRPKKKEAVNE
jgi:uncharacterized repeat protein (TIGR04138 family)